jgi:hypothetical protein
MDRTGNQGEAGQRKENDQDGTETTQSASSN